MVAVIVFDMVVLEVSVADVYIVIGVFPAACAWCTRVPVVVSMVIIV